MKEYITCYGHKVVSRFKPICQWKTIKGLRWEEDE